MEPDRAFLDGLERFGGVVRAAPADAWDRPSPCEGWSARDVMGHVLATVEAGVAILRGDHPSTPPAEPGTVVGDDPVGQWDRAAADVRTAMEGVDLDAVLDSPRGPRSVREGLTFPAVDLHVHAWDLGRAVGVAVELEPDVQEFVHVSLAPWPDEAVRRPGVLGAEQPAPEGATSTERLMAWTGRRVARVPGRDS